jgi:hypothetical protein
MTWRIKLGGYLQRSARADFRHRLVVKKASDGSGIHHLQHFDSECVAAGGAA